MIARRQQVTEHHLRLREVDVVIKRRLLQHGSVAMSHSQGWLPALAKHAKLTQMRWFGFFNTGNRTVQKCWQGAAARSPMHFAGCGRTWLQMYAETQEPVMSAVP